MLVVKRVREVPVFRGARDLYTKHELTLEITNVTNKKHMQGIDSEDLSSGLPGDGNARKYDEQRHGG